MQLKQIVFGTTSGSYQLYFQVWAYQGVIIMYMMIKIYHMMLGLIFIFCEFSESVLLGGADAAQRKSNFELKDIYTINMPEGDTVCDQVAIKLGFSIYDEYIKGILINAYNILSYIIICS